MRLEYMIELAAPRLAAYLSVELMYCMSFVLIPSDMKYEHSHTYSYTEAPRAFGLNKPPAFDLPGTKNSRYTIYSDTPDTAST